MFIMNNTIMAIAAGIGLIGFAVFLGKLRGHDSIESEGWAGLFGTTGLILTIMGAAVTIAWPYGVGETAYANIAFGEPSLVFGVICLFTSVYLWRNRTLFAGPTKESAAHVVRAMKPAGILVFVTGLMMAALAISWLRYQLGAAPSFEPISGLFSNYPWFEASFLFLLWGVVAAGCLLFPLGLKKATGSVMKTVIVLWMIGGIVFSLFGAMNFYTHIGDFYNTVHGTHYRI